MFGVNCTVYSTAVAKECITESLELRQFVGARFENYRLVGAFTGAGAMAFDTVCRQHSTAERSRALHPYRFRQGEKTMVKSTLCSGSQARKTGTLMPVFCLALFVSGTTSFAGTIIPQPKAGSPLQGLTAEQLNRFNLGKERFDHTFTDTEGLGPIFNKQSCGNCHNNRAGGSGTIDVTRFGQFNKGEFDPMAELGGSLLQENAITEACAEVVPDGAYTSHRITNSALAFGLVEAIPDADLEAVQAAQPAAQQGIIHYVFPFETPSVERVGRFGWKAQVATVLTFSADAAQNEIGISNHFVP